LLDLMVFGGQGRERTGDIPLQAGFWLTPMCFSR
jgi:hypothetical protein